MGPTISKIARRVFCTHSLIEAMLVNAHVVQDSGFCSQRSTEKPQRSCSGKEMLQ